MADQFTRMDYATADFSLRFPVGLADEAAEKLSYREIRRLSPAPAVARALAAAGVRPFDRDQVDAYKISAERNANRWIVHTTLYPALAIFVLSVILGVVFNPFSFFGCVVATVALFLFVIMTEEWSRTWSSTEVAKYREKIPVYVLRTALDVREALGDFPHIFFVEHLSYHKDQRGDPFLVLDVDGRREYLEVWDEPGFFQERIV